MDETELAAILQRVEALLYRNLGPYRPPTEAAMRSAARRPPPSAQARPLRHDRTARQQTVPGDQVDLAWPMMHRRTWISDYQLRHTLRTWQRQLRRSGTPAPSRVTRTTGWHSADSGQPVGCIVEPVGQGRRKPCVPTGMWFDSTAMRRTNKRNRTRVRMSMAWRELGHLHFVGWTQ